MRLPPLPGSKPHERMFGHLKHQRRIATRYDKTALSFASFLNLAAIRRWLPNFVNRSYFHSRDAKHDLQLFFEQHRVDDEMPFARNIRIIADRTFRWQYIANAMLPEIADARLAFGNIVHRHNPASHGRK